MRSAEVIDSVMSPNTETESSQVHQKRSLFTTSGSQLQLPESANLVPINRRKAPKISRACDDCRKRKAKCNGTLPCTNCVSRGLTCLYDASYSRGRPPTPPLVGYRLPVPYQRLASTNSEASLGTQPGLADHGSSSSSRARPRDPEDPLSRGSPELGITEIEGQVFDPTSGVSFMHRAWKRLGNDGRSTLEPNFLPDYPPSSHHSTPLPAEKPLPQATEADLYRLVLPVHRELPNLLALYFDVAIPTYHVLHRPSVEAWLDVLQNNVSQERPAWHQLGRPKAAIVLACLAVAIPHQQAFKGVDSATEEDASALAQSDHLFSLSNQLSDIDTGPPLLELTQVRIIQTLYLLTTFRMNRAWYQFGIALQLVSALGLHRNMKRQRHRSLVPAPVDYLEGQLRIRTFWAAYILDKYLGVIFGRPRHYHDDDIDQALPDRVKDEDMIREEPQLKDGNDTSFPVDALISHIKIAQIISQVSREVYSIKPISEQERINAAHGLSTKIKEWRSSLPPYLGSVPPSMLVAKFRKQADILRLNFCHALMHTNRMFLLAALDQSTEPRIVECIDAARTVLEMVDGWVQESPVFFVYWWTPYVAFCALVVLYVWDLQLKRRGTALPDKELAKHTRLMELAQRCQTHLANATPRNWPCRWYAIILEEFCSESLGRKRVVDRNELSLDDMQQGGGFSENMVPDIFDPSHHGDAMMAGDPALQLSYSILDSWNTTDWLAVESFL